MRSISNPFYFQCFFCYLVDCICLLVHTRFCVAFLFLFWYTAPIFPERCDPMNSSVQILLAMVIYMAAVIAIGIYFSKRANASSEHYFLGGRSLGPWVTAMSAEASDMSGDRKSVV